MRRTLGVAGVLLVLSSCQVAPVDRATLPPPLPDKVTPVPYADLLYRARVQVSRANDAFYVDSFGELEDAARGLEQTAQYLVKADDVPAKHKDTLATMSADLGKLAKELREAAVAKDTRKINAVMARLQSKVRDMRLAD